MHVRNSGKVAARVRVSGPPETGSCIKFLPEEAFAQAGLEPLMICAEFTPLHGLAEQWARYAVDGQPNMYKIPLKVVHFIPRTPATTRLTQGEIMVFEHHSCVA